MIPLRRFNDHGLNKFAVMLDTIRETGDADVGGLINHPQFTEVLSSRPVLEIKPLSSRIAAAQHIDAALKEADGLGADPERDAGLWAWLAAAFMDQFAPAVEGRRNIGASARWLPIVTDYRKYYRHLLAGPYRIYKAHREHPTRTMALLAGPVEKPGEIVEQFASRQDIVSSGALLEVITKLYWDPETGRLKPGAARKGPGGARRLADVLMQLDLTWDIYGMSPDSLVGLLPTEFSSFRK